jgi:hypothetical protein
MTFEGSLIQFHGNPTDVLIHFEFHVIPIGTRHLVRDCLIEADRFFNAPPSGTTQLSVVIYILKSNDAVCVFRYSGEREGKPTRFLLSHLDVNPLHLRFLPRSVAAVGRQVAYLVHNILSLDHLAEDRVLAVQPGLRL